MGRKEQPPFLNVGDKFGLLTIIADQGYIDGRRRWQCRCACGNEIVTVKHQLVSGMTRSCSCLQKETVRLLRINAATHGHRRSGETTPEYMSWRAMLERCHNTQHKSYKDYGGRGIEVCPEWRNSFEAFLADVGTRPTSEHSLGRRCNDEGYRPGNVGWETKREQAQNRRSSRFLTVAGVTKPLIEWARTTGLGRTTISRRLRLGWSIEDALSKELR
jgi:hypothetical protein